MALVTGGARRLGAHLARALAGRGFHVVVNTKGSVAEATALAASLPSGRAVRADVGDAGAVAAMFAELEGIEGRLDLLVHNVGVYEPKPLHETTPADWDAQIGPNLSGAFYCVRAALPLLRRARGSLVTIGYAGLHRGGANPQATAYEASKAGLLVLTRAVAAQYGPEGVRANMISPGQLENSVDLPDAIEAAVPLGRAGTLDDVAGALHFLLDAPYVTGQDVQVAGGYRL